MKHLPVLLSPFLAFTGLACVPDTPEDAGGIRLTEIWRTGGFEAPESIIPDPETGLFFVSNVNGEGDAQDGNGFISRITRNGEIDTLDWATGLDGPKGMALVGDRLYVTDITRVVAIDRNSGAIVADWPAPGAGFLNDAVAGPDGRIYVSDSATSRIYVLENNRVHVWAEGPALTAINGLWMESDRMLAVTMNGLFVSISLDGQVIEILGEGLGDGDALAPDGRGGYFSSEWPGQIYHLMPGGQFTVLADTRDADIYINDFHRDGDLLIIPHWNRGEVSAWRIDYSH